MRGKTFLKTLPLYLGVLPTENLKKNSEVLHSNARRFQIQRPRSHLFLQDYVISNSSNGIFYHY